MAWRGTGRDPQRLEFGAWRRDVARYAADLADAGLARGSAIALFCPDAYAFSVGLFAAWSRGLEVVSPPNDAPGTIEALRAEGCPIALAPTREEWGAPSLDFALHGPGLAADPPRTHSASPPEFSELEREQVALRLSTSGTTGEGKPVRKRLRHLEDEVLALERHFGGARLPAEVGIVATPSHQHLYGLLFRVLWPLLGDRPFYAGTPLQVEELVAACPPDDPVVLVSVPAHLSRVGQRDGAARLAERTVQVFSSGGPLAPETAHRWRELRGEAPIEVFGSTETGGVAYRAQQGSVESSAATSWTPFDCVSIERGDSDELIVVSPIASEGDAVSAEQCRFAMGDRVKVGSEGRFQLLGRADRTVKIGERRLSLPAMEARLREHPEVADAALATLERGGETRVVAVVSAREVSPGPVVADAERRSLVRRLGDALARDFDRVLLPRAWRVVATIPEDAQGKRPLGLLRALFDDEPAPSERVEAGPGEPRAVGPPQVASDHCVRQYEVPADLPCLEGHFPGAPIVPAIAQLDWALRLARESFAVRLAVVEVERLRLREALRPGDRFELRVDLGAERNDGARPDARGPRELGFALRGDREYCVGRLLVECERE